MMMRKLFLILGVLWLFATSLSAQKLAERLDELSKIYNFSYEVMTVDSAFTEKYILWFEQAVDPSGTTDATFRQRVFLSHLHSDSAVVFVTEGYAAQYAARSSYRNELSDLLNTNQIVVEHRYFGGSVPKPLVWEYLTVSNAAADQHRIIEVLKNIYKKKWISTGISKGGQTCMYHRFFYPEDVDISVPYVAPLNFSIEEKRVYSFLENVGTKECRERILNFQQLLMKNKSKLLPAFKKLAKNKGLTYSMGTEKAFELVVFEYSFAFWQWGRFDCAEIPENISNGEKIIRYLDAVAGIDWVASQGKENLQPFFYQAMREIGFYGYDIEPFKEWTSFTQNPTFEFTLPAGISVEYEPELMQQVDFFVRHEAENMLFIYGEYDPWSAPAVELTYHTNSVKVVKPEGSHTTRIKNLDAEQKTFVIQTLKDWLAK